MPTITDDIRAELATKHGEVAVFETSRFGDFAFRSANEEEFQRFITEVTEQATKLYAMRMLALATVVWPNKDALEAAFKAKPGIITSAANQVAEFSGLAQSEFRKK